MISMVVWSQARGYLMQTPGQATTWKAEHLTGLQVAAVGARLLARLGVYSAAARFQAAAEAAVRALHPAGRVSSAPHSSMSMCL